MLYFAFRMIIWTRVWSLSVTDYVWNFKHFWYLYSPIVWCSAILSANREYRNYWSFGFWVKKVKKHRNKNLTVYFKSQCWKKYKITKKVESSLNLHTIVTSASLQIAQLLQLVHLIIHNRIYSTPNENCFSFEKEIPRNWNYTTSFWNSFTTAFFTSSWLLFFGSNILHVRMGLWKYSTHALILCIVFRILNP